MRSINMQVLTGQIKGMWPGVTIYGIGDAAHQLASSDHNEDDTPGSRAAQSDADNVREHRAIDVMINTGTFTKSAADTLVERLVGRPANRARMTLIVWYGHQWRRSRGWIKEIRATDGHWDHPHISGYAPDDENPAPWDIGPDAPVQRNGDDDMVWLFNIAGATDGAIYLCVNHERHRHVTGEEYDAIKKSLHDNGKFPDMNAAVNVTYPNVASAPIGDGPLKPPTA
jgi:hypothetical protein